LFNLSVVFIAVSLIFFNIYQYFVTPLKSIKENISIQIPKGSSLNKICLILKKEGIIYETFKFKLLAKLKNAEFRIKAGEYCIGPHASPLDILNKLIRGEVKTYSITIPEGSTIYNIAKILESAGRGSAEKILDKETGIFLAKSLRTDNDSLEGFLFPDTYNFTNETGLEEIIKAMTDRFKNVFTAEINKTPIETGLSERETIILASLVEKETAANSEKPLISAVFLNRLKKGMKLECDPTVIYGIKLEDPEFQSRLRKEHLQKENSYNTYRIFGLPPGPICNPGLESIRAALKPAMVDYLYFVSKNDGTHEFSKTFVDHNKAVSIYQK
jgi:UPF0755 protein